MTLGLPRGRRGQEEKLPPRGRQENVHTCRVLGSCRNARPACFLPTPEQACPPARPARVYGRPLEKHTSVAVIAAAIYICWLISFMLLPVS